MYDGKDPWCRICGGWAIPIKSKLTSSIGQPMWRLPSSNSSMSEMGLDIIASK